MENVVTKILAANLPANLYMPVRVELPGRVLAHSEVQQQIEDGILISTGERVNWPALVRSDPDVLPVVMLDGFDELLQVSGVQRSDYLFKVAEFQQRERELGRSCVVLVTSRTIVADQAAIPSSSTVIRLESFGPQEIEKWLDIWNSTNTAMFTSRQIRPLQFKLLEPHLELAAQPPTFTARVVRCRRECATGRPTKI